MASFFHPECVDVTVRAAKVCRDLSSFRMGMGKISATEQAEKAQVSHSQHPLALSTSPPPGETLKALERPCDGVAIITTPPRPASCTALPHQSRAPTSCVGNQPYQLLKSWSPFALRGTALTLGGCYVDVTQRTKRTPKIAQPIGSTK